MSHTPGPWKYNATWALIEGPKGEEICAVHAATIGGNPSRVERGIAEGNAYLLRAAPELLHVLKEALYWCKQDVSNDDAAPPMSMLKARVKRLQQAVKFVERGPND